MPLDPELAPLLTSGSPSYSQMSVTEARSLMTLGAMAIQTASDEVELAEVRDVSVELDSRDISLRLYRPQSGNGGALIYFHGGGWVLGSIHTHDAYCRALAAASGATIVSVEYRLAPEHPFPAAAEDAMEVTEKILAGGVPQLEAARVGVGGDSAGGNLAAVACQQLRRRQAARQPACQLLIYPIVDCDNETPSYRENGEGYMLTKETMDWFWETYAPDSARRLDPLASPLRNHDLRGLPPALVLTAEYDPLRDEAEQYARLLGDSGGDVELKRYDGMIHGFVRRLGELKAARQALGHVAGYLRRRLGEP